MSDQPTYQPSVIKIVRFRLAAPNAAPLSWAFLEADLVPKVSGSRYANTIIPVKISTRTNQRGEAELKLYANDALTPKGTKYLITADYDGKLYRFLIELLTEMPDVVDFEHLLGRDEVEDKCSGQPEGEVKIRGSKYFY